MESIVFATFTAGLSYRVPPIDLETTEWWIKWGRLYVVSDGVERMYLPEENIAGMCEVCDFNNPIECCIEERARKK